MAKALIICAGRNVFITHGRRNNGVFKGKGQDIEVDAISATEGGKAIAASEFDLYLVSPQTKNVFLNSLKKQVLKSENQLFKFHLKPIFQSQWELKKWLI